MTIKEKLMALNNISKEDTEPKETIVTNEERINDLEIAICEILDNISE